MTAQTPQRKPANPVIQDVILKPRPKIQEAGASEPITVSQDTLPDATTTPLLSDDPANDDTVESSNDELAHDHEVLETEITALKALHQDRLFRLMTDNLSDLDAIDKAIRYDSQEPIVTSDVTHDQASAALKQRIEDRISELKSLYEQSTRDRKALRHQLSRKDREASDERCKLRHAMKYHARKDRQALKATLEALYQSRLLQRQQDHERHIENLKAQLQSITEERDHLQRPADDIHQEHQAEISGLQREHQAAIQQITDSWRDKEDELTKIIDVLEDNTSSLEAELARSRKETQSANDDIAAYDQHEQELRAQINELQDTADTLTAELRQEKEAFEEQCRTLSEQIKQAEEASDQRYRDKLAQKQAEVDEALNEALHTQNASQELQSRLDEIEKAHKDEVEALHAQQQEQLDEHSSQLINQLSEKHGEQLSQQYLVIVDLKDQINALSEQQEQAIEQAVSTAVAEENARLTTAAENDRALLEEENKRDISHYERVNARLSEQVKALSDDHQALLGQVDEADTQRRQALSDQKKDLKKRHDEHLSSHVATLSEQMKKDHEHALNSLRDSLTTTHEETLRTTLNKHESEKYDLEERIRRLETQVKDQQADHEKIVQGLLDSKEEEIQSRVNKEKIVFLREQREIAAKRLKNSL